MIQAKSLLKRIFNGNEGAYSHVLLVAAYIGVGGYYVTIHPNKHLLEGFEGGFNAIAKSRVVFHNVNPSGCGRALRLARLIRLLLLSYHAEDDASVKRREVDLDIETLAVFVLSG